jgi:hypothetical protein
MGGSDDIEALFDAALNTSRRRNPRRDMPAGCFVVIDGKKLPLSNMSPGGFFASGYRGSLAESESFAAEIAIRDEGFEFAIEAKAAVVRIDTLGLAAKLVSMGREQRTQLDAYFSHFYPWLKERR